MENTAGAGKTVGRTAEEVADILRHVPDELRERTGYGLDTCHLFASGWAIHESQARQKEILDEWEQTVGETPGFFHLNDSEGAFASNRDRHMLLGEGQIGAEPFRWLLADPRSRGIPLILETPQQNYEIGGRRRLRGPVRPADDGAADRLFETRDDLDAMDHEPRAAAALAASCIAIQVPPSPPRRPRSPDRPRVRSRGASGDAGPAPGGGDRRLVEQMAGLVNAHRRARGCPELAWMQAVADAAQAHSDDMARRNYFDHESPEGQGPPDRLRAHGVTYRSMAENIALHPGAPRDVLTRVAGQPGAPPQPGQLRVHAPRHRPARRAVDAPVRHPAPRRRPADERRDPPAPREPAPLSGAPVPLLGRGNAPSTRTATRWPKSWRSAARTPSASSATWRTTASSPRRGARGWCCASPRRASTTWRATRNREERGR